LIKQITDKLQKSTPQREHRYWSQFTGDSQEKDHMYAYDIGNPVPGLGKTQKCGKVKQVNEMRNTELWK
jgi:hypothetical protein